MNYHTVLRTLILTGFILTGLTAWAQEEQQPEPAKLNVNLTTFEELRELPEMTDDIAQAIIDNRPYASFLDVLELDAVSEDVLVAIEDVAEAALLNINTASAEELQRLPGITPELADAIIETGPYEIVEELYKVPGIGEEVFAELDGYITVAEEEGGDKGWKRRNKLLPGE